MRRALDISERTLGHDHPTDATRLNNLASLLKDTNRLSEAEPLTRRALEIREQSLGPDHPDVAGSLNNLASLLKATNRLAEAEPLMRRCVVILVSFRRRTGHDHPKWNLAIANYMNHLRNHGFTEEEIRAMLATLFEDQE